MNPDPLLLERAQRLVQGLRPFPTLDALRASAPGRALLAEAEDLLGALREHCAPDSRGPAAPWRLRVVHWNIEHGNRYERVASALLEHPDLEGADVLSLNEVDLGMARSGNRDVAFELAAALRCHAVWAPMFLELGVGRHDDSRFAAGAHNRESFFGIALLSRFPLGRAWVIPLPSPEARHFAHERMLGRHCALAAEVLHPAGAFVAVTAHLDVHRLPEHRREQMAVILRALGGDRRPVVLAGDFNTTTFRRGGAWDSLAGLAALSATPAAGLRRRLLRPDLPERAPREPLFLELARAGFRWEPYGDFAPSLRLRFERLGELAALPARPRRAALRALGALSERAALRLDWIAARGFGPGSGRTVQGLDQGAAEASDHAPLVAEIEAPGAGS